VYTRRATGQHDAVSERPRFENVLICAIVYAMCSGIAPANAEPLQPAKAAVVVPAHNRADLKEPPPRPPASDAAEKAKRLFEAIVADAPERADDVFFPRAAFLLVKDIPDPGKYYDRLKRRFVQDIHALHASLKDATHSTFERFELASRGGFVRVHEEGNRLPYWASRHSFIHYRTGGKLERLEVRVLITWDDRWYVIHLNEFRAGIAAEAPSQAANPKNESAASSPR
jgi:hypothetical protein